MLVIELEFFKPIELRISDDLDKLKPKKIGQFFRHFRHFNRGESLVLGTLKKKKIQYIAKPITDSFFSSKNTLENLFLEKKFN